MDTTEQANGYYFSGLSNLSPGELFFWVFLDETGKQIGVADLANLALIMLGQPMKATRAKPLNATPGTSILSYHLRQWLNIEVKQWRTLTNGSIRRLKFSYVSNLGAILADDVVTIAYKATNRYNTIANEKDRLW